MNASTQPQGVFRVAAILWNGNLGGAEIATLTLAQFLKDEGVLVTPVFVGEPGIIGGRFERAGFQVVSLGVEPGSRVLLNPRLAATAVHDAGPDCALLVSGGILAVTLRAGGYGGAIVAVEHGGLAQLATKSRFNQIRAMASWASGARLVDAFVGVSQFMVQEVRRHTPGCVVVHIPNGIDTSRFLPSGPHPADDSQRRLIVGCAGRLIHGKGFEDALDAAERVAIQLPLTLRIAGDGPLLPSLVARCRTGTSTLTVEFIGWCASMPDFWSGCDVAIVPSSGWIEAFGMTALEALASGVPVIASDSGGLPEVVADGICGLIYPAGNVSALSEALARLGRDPVFRKAMGRAARARVLQRFDARLIARAYHELFSVVQHTRAK